MTDAAWAVVGGAITGILGFLASRYAAQQQARRDEAEQQRTDEQARQELEKSKAELGQALYERVKRELAEMQATIDALRKELRQAETQINELQGQVSRLQRERDDWRARYEAATAAQKGSAGGGD